MNEIHTMFENLWTDSIIHHKPIVDVDLNDFDFQYVLHMIDWIIPTKEKVLEFKPPGW